ncbi:MAG TPA: hypothetical protein VG265_10795 [Gaiellaceae bacterium]|jgi:hypothetical protein|nr:hypothetical protein [Gaiellaceae bacterium]
MPALESGGRPYITPIEPTELPPGATMDPGTEADQTGLGKELGRGRSARTPFLALTGVGMVVAAVFAVVVVAAFLVYFLV